MKVISTQRLPIKMWLEDIEDGALEQAKHLADLPFAYKHIAIMPDCHLGYGMPIGGVLATSGVIIPNAVGVDIGCGMCAVQTSLTHIDRETLKQIMGDVRNEIPVGFNKHKLDQSEFSIFEEGYADQPEICMRELSNSRKSLGTLGGGNHFIEFQMGSDGFLWLMIHSGSRNLGKQVADHYNKIAIDLNEKWHSSVPSEWELAFLPDDSDEGNNYFREMKYCVAFALANRMLMMDRIVAILQGVSPCEINQTINIAHNYAVLENHFGRNVWIHRKGATLARQDTVGIIPGSQGTRSFIVKGKGNEMSFHSCSHGAGRKMGRNEAKKRLVLDDEIARLNEQGIIHSVRNTNDLDEASGAYKDISTVMDNQQDLVDVVVELRPLAVIKG